MWPHPLEEGLDLQRLCHDKRCVNPEHLESRLCFSSVDPKNKKGRTRSTDPEVIKNVLGLYKNKRVADIATELGLTVNQVYYIVRKYS